MLKAVELFLEAVHKLPIDFIAFPVEDSKRANVAIISPETIVNMIENDSIMIEYDKGEEYARMKRLYTVTKVAPIVHPVLIVPTRYRRVKDFPKHHNMTARGFELVVTESLNDFFGDGDAIHKGDDISSVDVVSQMLGNIECKFGRAKLKMET